MRTPALLLIACVVTTWAPGGIDCRTAVADETAAAKASPLEKRLAAIELELAGRQAELAEWAYANDLFREAGALASAAILHLPEHEIRTLPDRLEGMGEEEFIQRYREARKKRAKTYRKRLGEVTQPAIEQLTELAADADAAGDDALGGRAWSRVYELDSRNKDAMRALAKRDYELIFNYGALPVDEKEKARVSLRRLGGSFLGPNDKVLTSILEDWPDAWGLSTHHYRVLTSAPHSTVFQFAQACEDFHDAWEQVMKEARISIRKPKRPVTVYFFDSPMSYQAILRIMRELPIEGSLGFYSGRTKIGYFYDDPEFYEGNLDLLFETFYHEGTHQLIDTRLKTAYRGETAKYPLNWIEEGFALYLETLETEREADGNGKPEFHFGRFIDDDLERGLVALLKDDLAPLEEFVHYTWDEWDSYEYDYSHAALVMTFLMTADDGAYRKKAFAMLEQHLEQGGLRKRNFFAELGRSPEQLDEEIDAWARDILKRLPVRKYFDDGDDSGDNGPDGSG